MRSTTGITCALTLAAGASAIDLDINSVTSLRQAAKTIASNIISIYDGKEGTGIPGLFPKEDYYWWESGLAWDTLVNYWSLTGDDTYNDLISKALLWQVGPGDEYMPSNQTLSLGNDDQSTWALAAMTAAERGFPPPSNSDSPAGEGVESWVQLAQNVFDSQVARWDDADCNGGLRWQIYATNSGYNYKNSLSNGNFLQLAARLGKYTGNSTYTGWVQKVSTWSSTVGLIANGSWDVYQGLQVQGNNCGNINKLQFTSDVGTYISGYAYWSTLGGNDQAILSGLIDNALKVFTNNSVLEEVACAQIDTCNADQIASRTILARGLAAAKNFIPSYADKIDPVLQASAQAAAAQCSSEGPNDALCESSKLDPLGLSSDLSALAIILANIPANSTGTVNGTNPSGTNSTESPSASVSSVPASNDAASGMASSTISFMGALAFAVALCS